MHAERAQSRACSDSIPLTRLLWRTATTLQFGADAVAVIEDPEPWQQTADPRARGRHPRCGPRSDRDRPAVHPRAPPAPSSAAFPGRSISPPARAMRVTLQSPDGFPRRSHRPGRGRPRRGGRGDRRGDLVRRTPRADHAPAIPWSCLPTTWPSRGGVAALHGATTSRTCRSSSPAPEPRSARSCDRDSHRAWRACQRTAATPTRRGRAWPLNSSGRPAPAVTRRWSSRPRSWPRGSSASPSGTGAAALPLADRCARIRCTARCARTARTQSAGADLSQEPRRLPLPRPPRDHESDSVRPARVMPT